LKYISLNFISENNEVKKQFEDAISGVPLSKTCPTCRYPFEIA